MFQLVWNTSGFWGMKKEECDITTDENDSKLQVDGDESKL